MGNSLFVIIVLFYGIFISKKFDLKDDIIKHGIPNGVTAVVNLTGEPIMAPFKYFGNFYKKHIWISRIGSTMLLSDIIYHMECKPNVFIALTSTGTY